MIGLSDTLLPAIAPGSCGLLVSVRSAAEAAAALAGGSDVIDVKEPSAGPLGAPSAQTVCAISKRIGNRLPLTAAGGELVDAVSPPEFREPDLAAARGVAIVKFGLARAAKTDWRSQYARLMAVASAHRPLPVLAAYADHQAANAPPPAEALSATAQAGSSWLVLDTWDKSPGAKALLECLERDELERLLRTAQCAGVHVVVAGRLDASAVARVAELLVKVGGGGLVGVRGAACHGGRTGTIDEAAVRQLAKTIRSHAARPPFPLRGVLTDS
ncbi:(5-formylfuran-3-yl)methyl phosphate synthase [Botrimarina hoheduenensis]|uniref:(5-formylfuran-3-yl)methyl phosphate synthase n=1 Tax=Botrimarina hoheduenensis TaxID=2528000 RepID=A0A5C5WCV0_9BACT|nr:(5-formylfuran-3-yl)methyl phosphate synthase [Botrimarina hoheduenensis]TWT48494.1 hypothetical protein Pla111_02630 [Botrimarina hoheduenensis]